MNDVQKELAKFFVKVWYQFCENPDENLQDIVESSPLFEVHEITQEEHDEEEYDGEVGDTIFILTPLGEAARDLAEGEEDEETEEDEEETKEE